VIINNQKICKVAIAIIFILLICLSVIFFYNFKLLIRSNGTIVASEKINYAIYKSNYKGKIMYILHDVVYEKTHVVIPGDNVYEPYIVRNFGGLNFYKRRFNLDAPITDDVKMRGAKVVFFEGGVIFDNGEEMIEFHFKKL